jgi:hypothetical protein
MFFVHIDILQAGNTSSTQTLTPAPSLGLNCGTISCNSPKICVNRNGQPQCVANEANSSGVCQGDSNFTCPTGQACVKDSSGELGCETVYNSTSQDSNSTSSNTAATSTNPTGLLQGLQQFQGAGSGLNTSGTLIGYIANIIRWILGILGTVFFVIVVLQGYIYMTAGGDSSKTASAAGAIGNAVVGLLIIMGAFLITNFVTSGLINSGGGSTTTGTGTVQQSQTTNNEGR